METAHQPIESVVLNNSQNIDTWNKERTLDELRAYVSAKRERHDTFDDIEMALV